MNDNELILILVILLLFWIIFDKGDLKGIEIVNVEFCFLMFCKLILLFIIEINFW